MNVSEPFILRPVGTTLLMAAILLSGIVAYTFLPLSTLPQVDYPTIQVQTFYPGASPEVMTSSVTAPLERQLGQMPGLNQMTSASSAGASIITLQFSLDLSLDVAEQEVQAAINAANNLLPSDLPMPPVYAKVNPADAPILTLAVTSKTMSLTDLEDLSETRLAQKISQLTGVGLVSISGGHRPAVRIQFNPQALAAYGLNIDDVRTTIGNFNVNTPKGNFDGPAQATTINANDQIEQRRAIRQHHHRLSQRRSGPAFGRRQRRQRRREQQARRLGRTPRRRSFSTSSASPAPTSSRWSTASRRCCRGSSSTLPAAVDVGVLSDRTVTIRASVADVEFELALAVVLVVRRDLRVPAHHSRHHHPEPVGAAVAGRHARRHVSARLQPRQPVADGADHRHRLRGRRRHRHDREHRALRRRRHGAAARRRCKARSRSASPSSR